MNRGLADHHDLEFLLSEVRNVAKQLESASASASRPDKGQGGSQEHPGKSERAARTRRPEAQTDDIIIQAEIISGDLGDPDAGGDADPEPREEDLGR